METLKNVKVTQIFVDVKETDKYSWRRESNRQIFVETLKKQTQTLKKQTNIRGDVKETEQILVETLKKQTNIRGPVKEQTDLRGDVKETDKYSWRR